MIEKDEEKFATLMTSMAECFDKNCSPGKIALYFNLLKDLSIEEVEEAIIKLINTRTTATFPKVAEIRQVLKDDIETLSILAAEKVDRAIRKIGVYENIVFDDPVIHKVIVALGGWIKLCSLTEEEWKWQKKDFVKLYQIHSETSNSETPKFLIGIHGENNFGIKQMPIYIGDESKCLEWIEKEDETSPSMEIIKKIADKMKCF